MRTAAAASVFAFGVLVAFVGTGCIHLWPSIQLSSPVIAEPFLFPIIAFFGLAVAIASRSRFLSHAVIVASTALLVLTSAYLLAPSLRASTSTDAQTGMFEALLCMFTLPYVVGTLVVAAVVKAFTSHVSFRKA
jgi:hypothetical protein